MCARLSGLDGLPRAVAQHEIIARRLAQEENRSVLCRAVLIIAIFYEIVRVKRCARDLREEPMGTSRRTG